MSLTQLYESPDVVIVDKPAGLSTIPDRSTNDCLLARLAAQLGLPCEGEDDPRLRVVHRLDRDTSGAIAFAKRLAAQRHLCAQFERHTARKEYLALVAGRPAAEEGEVDAALAPHPRRGGTMTISPDGKPAQTAWRVAELFGRYALLRVFPRTGRMHQIRVHLASIGLPLAVDPLYGAGAGNGLYLSQFKRGYRAAREGAERPLIGRLTLHAARLSLRDIDEREVTVECPLPKDFRSALAQLRRHDPA